MLVVSRKQNQSITFPNLGISVEILRIAGKAVSVGVKAPTDVRILRGELTSNADSPTNGSSPSNKPSSVAHSLRNQLNKASLALHLVQKQLQAGLIKDADQTVAQTLESLSELDRQASSLAGFANTSEETSVTAPAKPHALLVEDNSNERELLAGYLRLSGYEVDTVEDGVAAVEFLNQQKPDVVVMDMLMPRMNGKQTVQHIRSNPAWDDIPLLIVSGSHQAEMQVPSGDRGISRWFQKPLQPNDLVEHLSTILN